MTDEVVGRVLDLLDRVKPSGDSWVASCPVAGHGQGNGDRNPSLSIKYNDGRVLLNCHTGCHVQDVLLSLGLEWRDLFAEPVASTDKWGHKVATWAYTKPDGSPYFTVERWEGGTGKRFVQRVPGHVHPAGHPRAGQPKAGYPPGFQPCIYNLPAVLQAGQVGGEVYIVEGEKSVSAARSLGLTATCAPNGAKAWQPYYRHWFAGCKAVNVIADNDEDGRRFAAEVAVSIREIGVRCQVLGVAVDAPKADLYDHVVAGFGVADLKVLHLNRLRPVGRTLTQLMTTDYPPVKWVIDRVLPVGLGMLGGTAKMGKSMLTLDLALAVAMGGRAFSGLAAQPGNVLYLSLDNDTDARLAERAAWLLGRPAYVASDAIDFHTTWPTGRAALACCAEWVQEADNPLLIVVDTLVRAEPGFEGDARGVSAYAASVEVLSRWSEFAQDNGLAVLAVHHTRKGADADVDWIDRFLGSRGLVATAQTLLMVDADRGAETGMLRVCGRDVPDQAFPILRNGWTWQVETPPRPIIQAV